jgi:hypothetical protein
MAPKAKAENTETKAARTVNTANFELDIDFSDGKSAQDITSERAQGRGLWPRKLQALLDGVAAGKGEAGKFYRIGSFSNASGARTVIREFERNPGKLPAAFDMEARVFVKDGVRLSELWASVPVES